MHAAGGEAIQLPVRGDGSGAFRRSDSHRGRSGRSAGGVVRTDLSEARGSQEYLWDRVFSADEYRAEAGVF